MANHKSSKKRIVQTEKRRQRNKSYLSSIRTAIKSFTQAAEAAAKDSSKKEEATKAFVVAQSAIAKGAKKGLFHANNAARKTSRLSAMLKKA